MASSKRNDEAQVYLTMGTTQTRNQACCSRQNDMTRKIDVSLAHRQKNFSGKKDQVAQLKLAW